MKNEIINLFFLGTVLIGLKDCLLNGTIKAGMQVVVAGFGVGLSWGGTILKFSNQN